MSILGKQQAAPKASTIDEDFGFDEAQVKRQRRYFYPEDVGRYLLRVEQLTDGENESVGKFFGGDFQIVKIARGGAEFTVGETVSVMYKPHALPKYRFYYHRDRKALVGAASGISPDLITLENVKEAGGEGNPCAGRLLWCDVTLSKKTGKEGRPFVNVSFTEAEQDEADKAA